jgi:hypothetical protein
LNDLLQRVANGVQSDLRGLNALSAAKATIVLKTDSIYFKYVSSDRTALTIEEAPYISFAFANILNTIPLNTNLSAFEFLRNYMYLGKIQGADLALLLDTYYTSADKIRSRENVHNRKSKTRVVVTF